MAGGYTVTAFAGSIGVSRESVYAWTKVHPAFADALKTARAQQIFYWEKRLHTAGKLRGDSTPIIFALKNACPDEWRDVQRLEHTGKDGSALGVEAASAEDLIVEMQRRGCALPQCLTVPIRVAK